MWKLVTVVHLKNTKFKNVFVLKTPTGISSCASLYFQSYLNLFQLMTMSQLCPVTAISWSPTRSGLVATLGIESPIVQLYDIQHASAGK